MRAWGWWGSCPATGHSWAPLPQPWTDIWWPAGAWSSRRWGAGSCETPLGRPWEWGKPRENRVLQDMLHCPMRLHLRNKNSKVKLCRILIQQLESMKPQAQGPSK